MKRLSHWVFTVLSLITLSSCEEETPKIVTDETAKDVTGDWKVLKLTRNGEDLSKRLDLNDFQISFKADGTYSLSEQLPFVVNDIGTYRLSDPQYPFGLILQPQGDAAEVQVKFQFPIIKGKRQLSLSFSLGCSSNTYQFDFERQN
ncbi:DUF5004 domain-containing protein [Sphingobacterium pedocola]|uniref:DUF5004 domain-containing protein n=1 Tax=Sphingobacterium pedocola TaxID=2082722 RepID=A0ABR9TCF2_9SPHI|nr:DUF5004 domain-containing protein [Sphingobacterium pedocola]MBE8722749.1 DUF5004 domain-containing protein [Sphingobacterium pedocola]